MVGRNDGLNDETNEEKSRYHGRRRNAAANIKFPGRRSVDNFPLANNNESAHESVNRNVHHRVQSGGVHNRLSKYSGSRYHTFNKASINKWKNDEDSRMKNDNQRTENQRPQYKKYDSRKIHYGTDKSTDRPKPPRTSVKPQRTYKIGETNDNETKQLIPSQPHCKLSNMDQNVFDLVVTFLKQYFTCYDNNRDDLLAAYHPKALFSICLNVKSQASTKQTSRFGTYFSDSRNLMHVGIEREFKMLQRNNIEIVAFLKKMPSTEHDANSFKLDTSFFQMNMLTFSIIGVFKEGKPDDKYRAFRSFQRVFVCVPTSNGNMVIVNEQYTISHISDEQAKIYKETSLETNIEVNNDVTPKPTTSKSLDQNEDIQNRMVQQFSLLTNLNLKWSKDCLEFSNWNMEIAERNFNEHKNEIPKDAFI